MPAHARAPVLDPAGEEPALAVLEEALHGQPAAACTVEQDACPLP